jgi:hypothetical protein
VGIWLEICACVDGHARISLEQQVLEAIPSLSEAISAARNAGSNKQSGKWEYSRRISQEESDKIRETVDFGRSFEDERSIIYHDDFSVGESCYTLRLFIEKTE